MKTIKQIADELGVDKQRVYRYIRKNHINEAHQKNGVMYYDEAAEMLIKQGFSKNDALHEAHHDVLQNRITDAVNDTLIEMLKTELDIKNRQIDELNARLAETSAALVAAQQTAQAAQALHAGTLQQHLLDEGETQAQQEQPAPAGEKKWWQFWK